MCPYPWYSFLRLNSECSKPRTATPSYLLSFFTRCFTPVLQGAIQTSLPGSRVTSKARLVFSFLTMIASRHGIRTHTGSPTSRSAFGSLAAHTPGHKAGRCSVKSVLRTVPKLLVNTTHQCHNTTACSPCFCLTLVFSVEGGYYPILQLERLIPTGEGLSPAEVKMRTCTL